MQVVNIQQVATAGKSAGKVGRQIILDLPAEDRFDLRKSRKINGLLQPIIHFRLYRLTGPVILYITGPAVSYL